MYKNEKWSCGEAWIRRPIISMSKKGSRSTPIVSTVQILGNLPSLKGVKRLCPAWVSATSTIPHSVAQCGPVYWILPLGGVHNTSDSHAKDPYTVALLVDQTNAPRGDPITLRMGVAVWNIWNIYSD